MRKLKDVGGGGTAVLPARADGSVRPDALRQEQPRKVRRPSPPLHADGDELADDVYPVSGRGRRIRRGLIPQTRNGWIAAGTGTLAVLLALAAGAWFAARYALSSPKFRIPASANIALVGNTHVTRSQILSIFGGDVDRSVFRVPMEQRRTELEAMPWVEHATVMRLLPNRLRVEVKERVPVAFARQGGSIGLVDKDGVLLDIPPDSGTGAYTFPVVTGVRADESAEGRAERMKLYAEFLNDLDSDGKATSALLSEIDLSNPEDVKALIPDHNSEILVHFGTEHFLERYRRFQEHLTEWRTQYPRLSGVDLRYDRQVVLQMPPKDSTLQPGATPAESSAAAAPAAGATRQPVMARPVVAKPAVAHASGAAKPHGAANDAATRKRVEAIRQWMAKREKARAAATGAAPGH